MHMKLLWPILFLTAVDVSFSETAVTVMEGDGRITLQLSVTGQLDSSVSVGLPLVSQKLRSCVNLIVININL